MTYTKNKLNSYRVSQSTKLGAARMGKPVAISSSNSVDTKRVVAHTVKRVIKVHEKEIKKLAFK